MSIDQIIAFLQRGAREVMYAKWAFLTAVGVIFVVLWGVFEWRHQDRFQSQSERINLLTDRLSTKPEDQLEGSQSTAARVAQDGSLTAAPRTIYIGGEILQPQDSGFFQLIISYQATLTAQPTEIKIVDVSAELRSDSTALDFPAEFRRVGTQETGWKREPFDSVTATPEGVFEWFDLLQFNDDGRVSAGAVKAGAYDLILRFHDQNGNRYDVKHVLNLSEKHAACIRQYDGVYAYWDGATFRYECSDNTYGLPKPE